MNLFLLKAIGSAVGFGCIITLAGIGFGWLLSVFFADKPVAAVEAPPRSAALQHQIRCAELRGEFFEECKKTMTRQQCEALYGQTRGHLFDGPPHLPFSDELNCRAEAKP